MSNVLLIPLGVGEAFTALHYTSCLVLGIDDDWLLIDCPHPVRKMLREASIAAGLPQPLDLDRIHAAAVTHLHADHCCGLEDFGYYSFFGLGRRAKLLMHPEASARVWDGLLAAGMELAAGEARCAAGPQATGRLLRADRPGYRPGRSSAGRSRSSADGRSTPCRPTRLRITAGGRVLGFSADTAYDPGPDRVALRRRPDRPRGDDAWPTPGLHTPYEKLAALPESLRAEDAAHASPRRLRRGFQRDRAAPRGAGV